MYLQDFFERIYIINLPERVDRRRAITRELEEFGISPSCKKIEIFPAIRPTDAGAFPNIGTLGCYLSHLEILRQVQKQGLKNVLILEDDVCFSKRFKLEEKQLIAQLVSVKWDMIYLGYFPYHGFDYSAYYGNTFNSNNFCSISILTAEKPPLQGGHFYGVNNSIFARLIDFLEQLLEERFQAPPASLDQDPLHLDGAYVDTAYHIFRSQNPDIITQVACPNLGWQRNSRSDIRISKVDQIPFLAPLLDAVRPLKTALKKTIE